MKLNTFGKDIFDYTPTAKQVNFQRYSSFGNFARGISYIKSALYNKELSTVMDMTVSDINNIQDKFYSYLQAKTHSFAVCPTCYKVLTKRTPKETQKNTTFTPCKICKDPENKQRGQILYFGSPMPTNYIIRSRFSQEEAVTFMKSNHPEVFI